MTGHKHTRSKSKRKTQGWSQIAAHSFSTVSAASSHTQCTLLLSVFTMALWRAANHLQPLNGCISASPAAPPSKYPLTTAPSL